MVEGEKMGVRGVYATFVFLCFLLLERCLRVVSCELFILVLLAPRVEGLWWHVCCISDLLVSVAVVVFSILYCCVCFDISHLI